MSRRDTKVLAVCTAPKGACGMGRRKARPMECDAEGQPVCFCGSPGRIVRKQDFTRTREAVQAYDADGARRDKMWADAMTDEAVHQAEAADKAAADKVREAFAEDTKEINSRDHAFLIHPDESWFRQLIKSV